MKDPIKISLINFWFDAFLQFVEDFLNGWEDGRNLDWEIMHAAYRGWKNTTTGVEDEDSYEPSAQAMEFQKIIDSVCLPYLKIIFVTITFRLIDKHDFKHILEHMQYEHQRRLVLNISII